MERGVVNTKLRAFAVGLFSCVIAGPSHTAWSADTQAAPRAAAVEFQVRNVNFWLAQDIILGIRNLRGQLVGTKPGVPVTFLRQGACQKQWVPIRATGHVIVPPAMEGKLRRRRELACVEIGSDRRATAVLIGEGNIAIGPDEINGIAAQAGTAHFRKPRKDVQRHFSRAAYQVELRLGNTVYVDLPVQ